MEDITTASKIQNYKKNVYPKKSTMRTIKIWNKPSDSQLKEIADAIRGGEIAIIPTDTSYGIAGDALNVKSVEKICKLKRINPEKSNLSVICDDISMAAEYSRIDDSTFRLIKDNTPGAFTFLLRAASKLPKAFKNRKTVGIRIPDNEFARMLAAELGNPVITSSIEYDDEDHAVNPGLIAESYEGSVDFMVEEGEGSTEVSTIVDCTGSEPVITRDGKGEL